ncbi:hypothetical protein LUZ63_001138 [Rhynchospora breviuscula]|uniref:Aminotransferase-like plant mobile domain-containing protein n=1 Tax=Rhynchospora breviuscula TaxID=2022672 RepID=A0A9Q0CXM7_9POAL|nr:hypothetical protein LUZ63_001138 [Rhynchospora breviuscula]
MPPRKKVSEAPPRRSTRLRGDPGASISTASVDAETCTSADPIVPPGPVNADRLLHLDKSKVRSTGDVAFLYGLPTTGRTVTGLTDYDAIQLLQNLTLPEDIDTAIDFHSSNSVQYNWGGATLAMLYRGLNIVFINNNINIGAPWLLLQLWSYARLLLSRPSITKDFDGWGLPSIDSCPPYGRKWTTRHKSEKFTGPTRSGIEYARDVCMKMKPEHVVWRSYDHIRDRMPRCAQVKQRMFLLRIPCIHYWIVIWHHVDRVMHQFMLYQTVPPPPPEPWSRMEELMGYQHNTYRDIDWHQIFVTEVNKWANTNEARVIEDRSWSEDIWSNYRRWLSVHGGAHLVQIPEGTASGPTRNLSYLRETPGHMNLVKHTLRETLRGCAWVVKKGFRRAGKQLLRGCSTSLDIVGEPDRLSRLLESKGIHSDIDSIPDMDDEYDASEPESVE